MNASPPVLLAFPWSFASVETPEVVGQMCSICFAGAYNGRPLLRILQDVANAYKGDYEPELLAFALGAVRVASSQMILQAQRQAYMASVSATPGNANK